MNTNVWATLKESRTNDLYQTHVSLFGPPGKFSLDRRQMDAFWDKYCAEIEGKGKSFKCGVAEKPQHYLPILVDVDLARKADGVDSDPKPIYSRDHVDKLVKTYQEVLRKIVDDCEASHLTCVVMTKKPYISQRPSGEVYIKHGFHLHFPGTFLSKVEQEAHLIPRVKEEVQRIRLFADAGFPDSAGVLDTSYCSVPWLVYGSRKAPDKDPYLFSRLINANSEDVSIEEGLQDYIIFDPTECEIDMRKKGVRYYLPRILSILPLGRDIAEVKSGLTNPVKRNVKKRQTRKIEPDEDFTGNLAKYRELVAMLSPRRASDRNDWMTIGWTLYNIGNGCEDARDMWIGFSRTCPDKFDETVCYTLWDKMVRMEKGEGSLRHYARADSPEAYEAFLRKNVRAYVQQSLNGSHYDIARAMYELYGTEYVCSSLRHQTWHYFKGHRWHEMEMGIFLRQKISGEILGQYAAMMHDIVDSLARAEDAGEKAMFEERFKQLTKLMGNLKNSNFKSNVMKEAAEVFYDPSFAKKLDKNPYLLCFQNGIYDVRTHQCRDGNPDDYVSLQAGVEYREFEPDAPEVLQVNEFLEKVFPDKSVREYFMNTSSDVFVGGNHHKLVQVWSGEGDNAKSVTQTLFEQMLADYAVKLPTSLIVGKRTQASAACPELVRAGGGVRFAVLQEPDQKDVINIGILKELSGNDTFFARTLFKEGGEITPMFKLILICNEPPQLPYGDKAVWNRIRVIPFESTFADDNSDDPPPDTFEEQLIAKRFPKDNDFAAKIPGMTAAFAYLLLKHREAITGKKRSDPPKVRMATELYRKKNDVYRQFVEESIVLSQDQQDKLGLGELYSSFKTWFKEAMPNHQIPVKNDICTYFTKAWGDPSRGMNWFGYRLRTLKDELDEGSAVVVDIEDDSEDSCADSFVPI